MKQKSSNLLIILFLFFGLSSSAQTKYERAYRIRKAQFPEKALLFIENNIKDIRKVRFYKEIDNSIASYEVKFKKDRLKYSIEFDTDGNLDIIEFQIKEVDIPEDNFKKITAYLRQEFAKYRIRGMQQQYPKVDNNTEKTIANAFQNILLPDLNYKFIVSGKKEKKYEHYDVFFDAAGNFLKLRKSLPPNYDHVLY